MRDRFQSIRTTLLFGLTLFAMGCGGGSGSGDKEPADADGDGLIEIATLQHLDWVRNDLAGTSLTDDASNANSTGCPSSGCYGYELVADLDFDTNGDAVMDASDTYYDYDGDGSNSGWLPIGGVFLAVFDGNGHVIRNLYINRPAGDAETQGENIGLFARAGIAPAEFDSFPPGIPAEIRDVGLAGDLMSVTGANGVGGLIGIAEFTTVRDSYSTGAVNGFGAVGGLAGSATGRSRFVRSYTTGAVSGNNRSVGGLVGTGGSWGGLSIIGSYATGAVSGSGSHVGGLIGRGFIHTHLVDSYATGDVSGGVDFVGGLAGEIYFGSDVRNGYATGDVSGGGNFVGGLVGQISDTGFIWSSHATGAVSGNDYVGGIVGRIHYSGDIWSSYATGAVSGNDYVGGLIGSVDVPASTNRFEIGVHNSFATGGVTGADYVGGLFGIQSHGSDLEAGFATGTVSGDQRVGGLVGDAREGSTIEASFATGVTSGTADVGGLIGYSDSVTYVNNHFATDSTGLNDGIGTINMGGGGNANEILGATLSNMQCPTQANDMTCPVVLYIDWDTYTDDTDPYWDFGTDQQLPGLLINGTVYRDSDGDGTLDPPSM